MNTKNSIIKICSLFVLLNLFSCEDYLERQPIGDITVDNFYKTVDDAEMAVNAAYAPLKDLWRRTMWWIGDLAGQDALLGGGGPTERGGDPFQLVEFTVQTNNSEAVYQCWQRCFNGINKANVVLDNINEDLEIETEIIKRVRAEALFLKAYYYFILVRVYGDVPIFDQMPDPNDIESINRDPKENVYEYIIESLESAAKDLPKSYTGKDVGRATKGAALTVLAKVHLTLKNWQACIDACSTVETLGYSLVSDYQNLYNWKANENGPESIFEVQYRYQQEFGEDNTMISEYSSPAESKVFSDYSYGFFPASKDFLNIWDEEDLRLPVTLLRQGDSLVLNNGKVFRMDSTEIWQVRDRSINPTATYTRKYLNFEFGLGQSGLEHGSTNMYIFRYSEVLLMHAEAENELNGGNATAHEYLNRIIERAYGDGSKNKAGLNQEALRDEIFKQRRKEFHLEQKRWFDIIRQGPEKAKEILHGLGKTNFDPDIHMVLPIPINEMDLMTHWKQNPGY